MSQTELYIVKKNGDLEFFKGFGNSHRGASLLWSNLWKKYYPELRKPLFNDDKNIEKLWRLDRNPDVPRELKILHISTFDRMMIKKENLEQFIEAMENVYQNEYLEDMGHFETYPEILKDINAMENVIAIAWNQTSINSGYWDMYEECPTCGEYSIERSYNIFKDKKHQFLFEYLNEIEQL